MTLANFLDALVDRLDSGVSGVQIVDGPPVEYIRSECIAVGITTEDARVESATAQAGLRATRETVDVVNLIRVWSGDVALAPLRRRAYTLLDAVHGVLREDPTVGDTVGFARPSGHAYTPVRDESGVGVFLEFRIRIDAFPT